LSVLEAHIGRCEAEIEALKQELERARRRASERDIVAAELATFRVVVAELRSERKYWREHAERLSSALMSAPQRSRWPWLRRRFSNGLIKVDDPAEGHSKAREAAVDAGLLPSAIGTKTSAANPQLVSTSPRPAATSLPDKGGPSLSASDLERAIEQLSQEIEDAQAAVAREPLADRSCPRVRWRASTTEGWSCTE
jgi:hypothetical protein